MATVLPTGTNLDNIKAEGTYLVRNPEDMPEGHYWVLVIEGADVSGNNFMVQRALNIRTAVELSRAEEATGFTEWVSGGGEGSDEVAAEDVSFNPEDLDSAGTSIYFNTDDLPQSGDYFNLYDDRLEGDELWLRVYFDFQGEELASYEVSITLDGKDENTLVQAIYAVCAARSLEDGYSSSFIFETGGGNVMSIQYRRGNDCYLDWNLDGLNETEAYQRHGGQFTGGYNWPSADDNANDILSELWENNAENEERLDEVEEQAHPYWGTERSEDIKLTSNGDTYNSLGDEEGGEGFRWNVQTEGPGDEGWLVMANLSTGRWGQKLAVYFSSAQHNEDLLQIKGGGYPLYGPKGEIDCLVLSQYSRVQFEVRCDDAGLFWYYDENYRNDEPTIIYKVDIIPRVGNAYGLRYNDNQEVGVYTVEAALDRLIQGGRPITNVYTESGTLSGSIVGHRVEIAGESVVELTLPLGPDDWPNQGTVTFVNYGPEAAVFLTQEGGTLISTDDNNVLLRGGKAELYYRGGDVWVLTGDLTPGG